MKITNQQKKNFLAKKIKKNLANCTRISHVKIDGEFGQIVIQMTYYLALMFTDQFTTLFPALACI